MGLGGEELSKLWSDLYHNLIDKQMNSETYKKLIEYSKELYMGALIEGERFNFIKVAFSVDDEAFLSEDLAIQKSMNINFPHLFANDQKEEEKY